MSGLLTLLWVLFPAGQSFIILEQPAQVLAHKGNSVFLQCLVHIKVSYIHWYRQQEGQAPQRLLYVNMFCKVVQMDSVLKSDKITSVRTSDGRSCSLLVRKLEKGDDAGQSFIILEQPAQVLAHKGNSVFLQCLVHIKVSYIHWYRQQEGQAPQRLLYVNMFCKVVQMDSVLKSDKITSVRTSDGRSCSLLVRKLEKGDDGVYYCATWSTTDLCTHPAPAQQGPLLPDPARTWTCF
ncbi:T-cell receptor gamma chain V region PT-gamma-1/2 [Sciurus carolinensis]|nr:T-cell receptor gamma chain V region PT-gamma-1/2 [Sciurus carolinensis]